MTYLDEAAILAVLEHVSDARQRARLSTVSRLWHMCVTSSWQRLQVEGADQQQLEKRLFWLRRQLPNNPTALQWLLLSFRGGLPGVYLPGPGLTACLQAGEVGLFAGKQETDAHRLNTAQLRDFTRFTRLRRLHLAHVEKEYFHISSALLVPLEELQHLQVLQQLVDLAIMCPGCALQGDASLCKPACWPKLRLLHLRIDDRVWAARRQQQSFCLEDTINSLKQLEIITVLDGVLDKPIELPRLTAARLACNREENGLPLGDCPRLRNLAIKKGQVGPGQLSCLTALSLLQDCSVRHAWTPAKIRAELAPLPNLRHLALSQYEPHRSNTRLQEFGELTALVNLRLSFDCAEPVNIYLHSSLFRLEKLYLGDPVIADVHRVVKLDGLPRLSHVCIHAMAQPLLVNLPCLRVLALRGAGGWAMAGPWPHVHEPRHFVAAEFKNMQLPVSPQHMQHIVCDPAGQMLRQLSISVCTSPSVDIEGWNYPSAEPTGFDFMAHLLHSIEQHMPHLHHLSLAAINHCTRLPLGPISRLRHFAVAAHSIAFEQPLSESLPPHLASMQILCLEADEQTQAWLATKGGLPLRHTLMESFYVLSAKRGPPNALDIDASILDDLDSHATGGTPSQGDSGEGLGGEPAGWNEEGNADADAWQAESSGSESDAGSDSSMSADTQGSSESVPARGDVSRDSGNAAGNDGQHVAGKADHSQEAESASAVAVACEQNNAEQSEQPADRSRIVQSSATSPVQRTLQATTISSPVRLKDGE